MAFGSHASVRQFAVSYETDPIEFTAPETGGYKGPFPIDEFDDAIIEYTARKSGDTESM